MKYYIYVSDTKVDMLYAQIPQSFLSKISVELKIDAKILSTTFKRPSSEENRYSKLEILSRYIQENEKVGTSDFHDNYIQDRLPMRWMSHGNLVYFSGAGNKSIIGLAGSSRNVLGFIETKYEGHDVSLPSSSPLDVLNRLAEIFDAEDKKNYDEGDYGLEQVLYSYVEMSGSVQNFEFLARRQAYKNVIDVYDDNMRGDLDSWYGKKAIKRNRNNKEFEPYLKDSNYRLSNIPKKDVVILGSPIYVALSD